MGEAAGGHDVGQARRDRRVGGGLRPIVFLRLLRGLRTEEHRVVGVLVVAERQEAEVRQLEFTAVGDGDLGRALGVQVAVVRGEHVVGQVLHLAAALGAADGGAEAVLREGVGQPGAHRVGGVHPAVFVMVHRLGRAGRVVRRFLVVELVDRLGRGAVGQAGERARQHQVDEARILAVAEAAPLGVFLRLEDLREVARLGEFGPAVEAEHAGAGGRDERRERGCRDV